MKVTLHVHELLLLTVLWCVSDESVQELAEELVELGLISEVGVSCVKERQIQIDCVCERCRQMCVGDTVCEWAISVPNCENSVDFQR